MDGNFFLTPVNRRNPCALCKYNSKLSLMDPIQLRTVRAARWIERLIRRLTVVWLGGVLPSIALAAPASEAPRPARPDFSQVIQVVQQHFDSLAEYQAGDLLTRSQVESVLQKLQDSGWDIRDGERITQLALADDSFLAKQFSTAAGRSFMRKIARHPGAYSHVDRLSSISGGERIVRDLVRQRGGEAFIEYLATTQGGRNLGNKLAHARRGADLNRPTGRMYTAADLLEQLRLAYERTDVK
jgi:hypothetical protein